MEIHRTELTNNKIISSLNTIRVARIRIHLLARSISTPATLISQIKLCEVLLKEILTIRSSLKGRMEPRGSVSRRSIVAMRNRGSGHLIVPQSDRATRSNLAG
jgi:hypothetical protein